MGLLPVVADAHVDPDRHRQFQGMLGQAKPEQLKMSLQKIEQQESSVPPEQQKVLQVIKKMIQERIKQLEGGK